MMISYASVELTKTADNETYQNVGNSFNHVQRLHWIQPSCQFQVLCTSEMTYTTLSISNTPHTDSESHWQNIRISIREANSTCKMHIALTYQTLVFEVVALGTYLVGTAVDAVVVLSVSDIAANPPAQVPAPPARGISGALLLRIHCLFQECKD
jgi:hypothetical protein